MIALINRLLVINLLATGILLFILWHEYIVYILLDDLFVYILWHESFSPPPHAHLLAYTYLA